MLIPKNKKYLVSINRIDNPKVDRNKFIRLDKNENLNPINKKVLNKIRSKISSNFLNSYPNLNRTYKKISKWLKFLQSELYLSAGSDAAIKSAFECFVFPQDKVLILNPTYAMYSVYIKLFQAQPIFVNANKKLEVDSGTIIQKIRFHKPALICIANPNSPTGKSISINEIEKICNIAEASKSIVLIDEAYHFYDNKTALSLIKKFKNVIVTLSFSKALGLACARAGVAVSNKNIISLLQKFRPMYEINSFAALALEIYLNSCASWKKNINKTLQVKKWFEKKCKASQITSIKSDANFINIDCKNILTAKNLQKIFLRKKFLVSCSNYIYLRKYIRLSVGTKSQMRYAFSILKKYLKKNKKNDFKKL